MIVIIIPVEPCLEKGKKEKNELTNGVAKTFNMFLYQSRARLFRHCVAQNNVGTSPNNERKPR